MNPRDQDCFGYYLYGAGYYAREDNTLSVITGGKQVAQHFCRTCPVQTQCEAAHEQRLREAGGEAIEQFDRLMQEAQRRQIPPLFASFHFDKQGLNPFAASARDNFTRGHADRGRIDGALTK